MRKLVDAGSTVLLETNGSQNLEKVPPEVHVVMDVKCPSSGMHDKMDFWNFKLLRPTDDVKFVLANEEDYNYAKDMILKYHLYDMCNCILSPVTPGLRPQALASWLVRDTKTFGRLVWMQLQLHKILWDPNERKR